MRESCYDCTRKHLAEAVIFMIETELGYKDEAFGWLAVGCMSHAEQEILAAAPGIAELIREHRLTYINYLNADEPNPSDIPYLLPIVQMVTEQALISHLNDKAIEDTLKDEITTEKEV